MAFNTKNSTLYIKFLREIHNTSLQDYEVTATVQYIENIIDNEINNYKSGLATINQSLLTLAARAHCELTKKYNLSNIYFKSVYELKSGNYASKVNDHFKLQALLLSNQYSTDKLIFDGKYNLLEDCIIDIKTAIYNNNSHHLLLLLKSINLIYEKCCYSKEIANLFNLNDLYICLQHSQPLIKNETLLLLNQLDFDKERALKIFLHIMTYWPWMNKNKFYILNAIINKYTITECLTLTNCTEALFLKGIRVGLLHKELITPSQSLIRVMADNNCALVFNLIADILMNGSIMEVQSLCLYWLPHIHTNHADQIFQKLSSENESQFISLLKLMPTSTDNSNVLRLTVLLNLFPKQIAVAYDTYYHNIRDELIKKYNLWDIETQILIYKFVIDYMEDILPLQSYLEFVYVFILQHKCVQNARIRNHILSKIPNIVNYIARIFKKNYCNNGSNGSNGTIVELPTLLYIKEFFCRLETFIENEMFSNVYQPKVFSLKILEALLKNLFECRKNVKQFNTALDNQKLVRYLKQENIFNYENVFNNLFTLIKDPAYYDDTRDLTLNLLRFIPFVTTSKAELIEICQKYCSHDNIDNCNISANYAEIFIHICQSNHLDVDIIEFFNNMLNLLTNKIIDFMADPLLACKTKGAHLFGYISVLSKIIKYKPSLIENQDRCVKLLTITEDIVNKILNMLNITNESGITGCASFEDMEYGLTILIERSSYNNIDKNGNEDIRKFLLLSLWFTLRACCELSTIIGSSIVKTNGDIMTNVELCVQRCILTNVYVLMRCRHKGAIEYAGHCIGLLMRNITTYLPDNMIIYAFLEQQLLQLYNLNVKCISRTRRGAGFSLMLLHILKNENYRTKPLLRSTLNALFQILKCNSEMYCSQILETNNRSINFDCIETLILHYLCVLVRDTDLRDTMNHYYNDIMMYSIFYISNQDWAICNAALQLFGALLTKVIGQPNAHDHSDYESNLNNSGEDWAFITSSKNVNVLTFTEIIYKYPTICDFVLHNIHENKEKYFHERTRSTIVFLEFFQNVNHYYIEESNLNETKFLEKFRQLTWSLLWHPYAKIRKLASVCLIKAHNFKYELPLLLLQIIDILFKVKNENFFEGLLLTIHNGISKITLESQFLNNDFTEYFLKQLRQKIKMQIKLSALSHITHTPYCLCKLFDILVLLNLQSEELIIHELKQLHAFKGFVGTEQWLTCIKKTLRK